MLDNDFVYFKIYSDRAMWSLLFPKTWKSCVTKDVHT